LPLFRAFQLPDKAPSGSAHASLESLGLKAKGMMPLSSIGRQMRVRIADTDPAVLSFDTILRIRPCPKILRIVPGKMIEIALSPPHVSKRH